MNVPGKLWHWDASLAALLTNVTFKSARDLWLSFLNPFCLAQDPPWTDLPPEFAAGCLGIINLQIN